jgi:calcium/calmodulin-dependent protein kinase I
MTTCGSPIYVAPEVLKAEGYGKEVDMWSVGVITYLMLAGFPPFMSEQTAEMFDMILSTRHEYPEEYFGAVSAEAKAFIDGCLEKDPTRRLTAAAASKAPWLNGRSGPAAMKIDRMKSFVLERQATKSKIKL